MPGLRPPAFLLALCLTVPSVVSAANSVVLVDARCVDLAAEAVRAASVWIDAGSVRAVGAADGEDLDAGPDVPRVDLDGAYLLPGLIDLRVYGPIQRSPGHRDSLSVDDARRLALASGVTGVLDVFGRSDATDATGASWWGGAPLLVARGAPEAEFPNARPVDSPQMAASLLANSARSTRPLQVVYDGRRSLALGPETLAALIDGAGTRPVAVQVQDWVDVRVALEQGARWFVQVPVGPAPDDVRQEIVRRGPGLAWTPQVALGLDFAAWARIDSLRNDPGLARVLPDTMRDDYGRVRIPQARYGEVDVRARDLRGTMDLFREAGTTLRAGSGAGAVGTAIGFSLVRELEWWVELGLDPWTALRAATVEAAAVLGRRSGFEVGAAADFVLLDASPLDDLAALRAPARVIRGGEFLEAAALAATVVHRPVEDLPDHPLPGGGRIPPIVLFGAGFAVLLLIRRQIKRAAARALAEEESLD